MKAMILAAGRGERMRPLTDETPKPLLTVGDKTLIEYHLERLKKRGIDEVVINISWLAGKIEDYLGDGSRWGLTIHYSREADALETAGGIIQALPLLGDEPFLLLNGDVWSDYPVDNLLAIAPTLPPACMAYLILVDNPEHHPEGDFNLADNGCIVAGSDSERTTRRLTFSGISLLHPRLFATARPGKQALKPFLERAMLQQGLWGEYFAGQWLDVGTPERLAEINRQSRPKGS